MKMQTALLESFFRGECTEPEKQAVQEYLYKHPDVLSHYLTEDSWSSFKEEQELPVSISDKMLRVIEGRINKKGKAIRLVFKWASVAAVLLISFGLWLALNKPARTTPVVAAVTDNNAEEKQTENVEFHFNATVKSKTISLKDGSTVELAPASEIRFAKVFDADKRDIYLKGVALFKVAKDATRPFTVYAGGLGTTALGTVFRISELDKSAIRVELFKGRVVVRPDSSLKSKGITETYLKPGQQLNLDKLSFAFSVKKINNVNASYTATAASSARHRLVKETLHFSNRPLSEIIKILETKYQLKFRYADGLLNEMDFTGDFNENKESVEDFLNTICLLNALTIKREKNVIHVIPNTR